MHVVEVHTGIETSIRSFGCEIASPTERKSTRRVILEHEIKNLHGHTQQKKNLQERKRAILKNKLKYTVEELCDGVSYCKQKGSEQQKRFRNITTQVVRGDTRK